MAEPRTILDLAIAIAAAFLGGIAAQRLGLPPILGYVLAGVAIGPLTPGPIANVETIQTLAEIGVAFLLFSVGAEFSPPELRQLGRVASVGGTLQIALTAALGVLIGSALGLPLGGGVLLGAILALSSTVVALKVLGARGEAGALHGRAAVAVLVAQDVAAVPMIVLLPFISGGTGDLTRLAELALKAAAVLVLTYAVGARAVPWLLAHAALPRSRELFLLGVVSLAVGAAVLTEAMGLSFAFGAFLAGLVVAGSELRTQVVAEALPLRDIFISLFFVSVGMLADPRSVLAEPMAAVALASAVVVGKAVIATVVFRVVGLPGRSAILAGVVLAQIGELSFVLARLGLESGALARTQFDLVLATAVLSIVLAPFLPRIAPALATALAAIPLLGRAFADPAVATLAATETRRHAVICGYGRMGQELASALESRGFRFVVVELNPFTVRALRERGAAVVFGDAANPAVLDLAGLDDALVLAVLVPDALAAERATAYARARFPRLDIVARASGAAQMERLRRAGASDVVQPEFEAGVEVIRHALRRFGVSGLELANLAAGRRASFYRTEE